MLWEDLDAFKFLLWNWKLQIILLKRNRKEFHENWVSQFLNWRYKMLEIKISWEISDERLI